MSFLQWMVAPTSSRCVKYPAGGRTYSVLGSPKFMDSWSALLDISFVFAKCLGTSAYEGPDSFLCTIGYSRYARNSSFFLPFFLALPQKETKNARPLNSYNRSLSHWLKPMLMLKHTGRPPAYRRGRSLINKHDRCWQVICFISLKLRAASKWSVKKTRN